jgi:hypothetical protein
MIPAQVYGRVLQFSGEEAHSAGMGAAVLLNFPNGQRLVTARHLTNGEHEEYVNLRAPYIRDGDWFNLFLSRVGDIRVDVDVALYELTEPLIPLDSLTLRYGLDSAIYTQDVYLLGHPYGLSLQFGGEENLDLPLTKRGILAGTTQTDQGELLLIDTIANPGFSGGPAVFKVQGTEEWRCMGIIKGQYVQDAPIANGGTASKMPAGITAVTSIDSALEMLDLR